MERKQPMDKTPTTRQMILLALTICVAYLGYQAYQRSMYSWRLAHETRDDAVPTAAITHARPGPTRETLKLPGNIDPGIRRRSMRRSMATSKCGTPITARR